ncbi:MAG: hypothetical protein ACHQRO_08895, partial [Vicinamibacteria bacterium]
MAAACVAHGAEADIVATQLVAARGLRGLVGLREVEVTVVMTATGPRQTSARRPAPVESDDAPSIGATPAAAGVFERLRIAARRGARHDAASLTAERPDPLVAQLLSTGLDRDLAVRVARAVPRGPRRIAAAAAIEAALATELGGLVSGDEPFAPVELFVGPPGAGKTTTIAKIAARERAQRGRRLSLLAADGFRVGAVEQLRLYADLIGSPFAV